MSALGKKARRARAPLASGWVARARATTSRRGRARRGVSCTFGNETFSDLSIRVVRAKPLGKTETLPRLLASAREATSRRAEVRRIAQVLEERRERRSSCPGCPQVSCVSPARPRPRVSPRGEPSVRCHASSHRAELARPTREVEVARPRVLGHAPRAGARAARSWDTPDTPLLSRARAAPFASPPRRTPRTTAPEPTSTGTLSLPRRTRPRPPARRSTWARSSGGSSRSRRRSGRTRSPARTRAGCSRAWSA